MKLTVSALDKSFGELKVLESISLAVKRISLSGIGAAVFSTIER